MIDDGVSEALQAAPSPTQIASPSAPSPAQHHRKKK